MSDKRIGIVGAGTAGLHLGMYLRRHDVPVTIYTSRTPEQVASGRVLNTVAHHHVTLARETELGINHWSADEIGYCGHHYYVNGPEPLSFFGRYQSPSRAVDYRLYHPRLMEDFLEAGGEIVFASVSVDEIPALRKKHDLVAICSGRGSSQSIFKRDERESTFDQPLRLLCAGLFTGIAPHQPNAVTMYFSPGHGEMIEIPMLTAGGMCTALVIENVPGGDMEVLAKTSYKAEPKAFRDLLLDKFEKHYAPILERIDVQAFDLADGPRDLLQGGFSPTVRRSHCFSPDGSLLPAVGDMHALVDPLTGQGANMAAHGARILGEEILGQDCYDARFMEVVDRRRSDRILSASRWTNRLLTQLVKPSDELGSLFECMNDRPAMCDEFTENFNYPERQWDRFASPERLRQWVAGYSGSGFGAEQCFARKH